MTNNSKLDPSSGHQVAGAVPAPMPTAAPSAVTSSTSPEKFDAPSTQDELLAGAARVDAVPLGAERLQAIWNCIEACDVVRRDFGRKRNRALHQQLAMIYVAGRKRADAADVDARLAKLGQVPTKSNKPFLGRVIAGFGLRYMGPQADKSEKSQGDQYATALDGLERIVAAVEAQEKRAFGDGAEAILEATKIIAEHTVAGLAELARKKGDKVDDGRIPLNEEMVEERRLLRGARDFAVDVKQDDDDTGKKVLGDNIFLAEQVGKELRPIRIAPLNTPRGKRFLGEFAKADDVVEMLGDAFLMGTACVGLVEPARRQLIVRANGDLVYSATKIDADVIVEVHPSDRLREVLLRSAPMPRVDLWVRPNERPRLEANIRSRDRRIAFSFGCIPANTSQRKTVVQWQLTTEMSKGNRQPMVSAALLPAALWGEKGDDRLPLDVKQEDVSRENQSPDFRSFIKPNALTVHANGWLGLASSIATAGGKIVKSGKIPDEALSKVAQLRFNDRRVQVLDGTLDLALRHDPGAQPETSCPEVGVVLRDWVAPVRALADLRLTADVTLEVWRAGLLCLKASTEHAQFVVWVPLTTPHDRRRSRDLLRPMRFASAPIPLRTDPTEGAGKA